MTFAVLQRWRLFRLLPVVVLGVMCLPHGVHAQLIKFATLAPDGTAWMNLMDDFTTEVERRTGGKVTFRIFANMVAGDESVVLQKIRIGQLHGGGFTGNGLGKILPEVRVLELPYLFQSEWITKILLFDRLCSGVVTIHNGILSLLVFLNCKIERRQWIE